MARADGDRDVSPHAAAGALAGAPGADVGGAGGSTTDWNKADGNKADGSGADGSGADGRDRGAPAQPDLLVRPRGRRLAPRVHGGRDLGGAELVAGRKLPDRQLRRRRLQAGVDKDGKAEPQRLAIPVEYACNNDKALSPDGKRLAFSATVRGGKGSQVFLSNADGRDTRLIVSDTPSYFHGWSPDGKTLAFVAQRNGSGQYDIYGVPAAGGPEVRLTSDVHQDDGPDYSPDGRWIYINSDRSGKQAVWRFPAGGAGRDDAHAEMVVNDRLQDWFPHISPDGTKLVYIGYPAGTPTHNPRDVRIALKLVAVNGGTVVPEQRTLLEGVGGQGSMNVNSWAPDSRRFAYVTYEALP